MDSTDNTHRADLRSRIADICAELAGHGTTPTNAKVRDALGGGSLSDIQPLVKEWKEQRSAAEKAALEAPAAPQEFTDLWPTVWKLAIQTQEAAQKAWQGKQRELESEIDELRSEITRLESGWAETEERLDAEAEKAESAIAEVKAQRQDLTRKLGERQEVVEESEKARAAAEARAESAETHLDQLRELLPQYLAGVTGPEAAVQEGL